MSVAMCQNCRSWLVDFVVTSRSTEIDQLQTEVAPLLPKLQPGFDCISDIANMRPAWVTRLR